MAVKSLGLLTLDLVAKINQYTEPMGKAERTTENSSKKMVVSLNNVEKSVEDIGSASERTKKLIGSLVATAGVGISVSSMVTMADSYTQMGARIRNATVDTIEYNLVQGRLLETANTTFRALSEAQEVYLSLSGGMKSLGYATKDTLDLSDSLSFAFTANATRADQAQSAMDSLSKSMAKGKIDADAWISIVTGADNIIADMAKTTGMTEAQIRQLGAEGKASLEDLIKTLISTREANKQLADSMENSFSDGVTKLTNSATVFIGKLNESTGATGTMAAGLGMLGDNIELVAVGMSGLASLYAGRVVQSYAASISASMKKSAALKIEQLDEVNLLGTKALKEKQNLSLAAQEIRLAQQAIINAKSRDVESIAIQRLTTAEIAYEVQLKKSNASTLAYKSAQDAATLSTNKLSTAKTALLGLTGGWIGLGVTVAGVAASYLLLNSNSNSTTVALNTQSKTVAELRNEYQALEDVQQRVLVRQQTKDYEAATIAYSDNREQILGLIDSITRLSDVSEKDQSVASNLFEQYRLGKISATDLSTEISRLSSVSAGLKSNIDNQALSVQDSATKANEGARVLSIYTGRTVDAGKAAIDAAEKHEAQANSLNNVAVGANNASNSLVDYANKALQAARSTEAVNTLLKKGYNQTFAQDLINATLEKRAKLNDQNAKLSNDEVAALRRKNSAQEEQTRILRAQAAVSVPAKSISTKSIGSGTARQQSEIERIAEQDTQERINYLYQYADEYVRIEKDLQKELEEIRTNSKMSSNEKQQLIAQAKSISKARKQVYLNEYDSDLFSWNWTEDKKLESQLRLDKARIDATKGMGEKEKQLRKDALDAQYTYELQEFKRTQQEKIAQAAMAIADIRTEAQDYMLQQSDPRAYAWSMLNRQQNSETSELDKAYQTQVSSINELDDIQERNSQLLAAQQQYLQAKAELEEKYAAQSDALNISQMQTLMTNYSNAFGFVAGVMQGFGDDSSTAYKTAFALQKAFALSSALLSAKTAVMSAWSDPANVTIYQKMAAAALAAVQTEGLLSSIQGVMPQGFSDGGYTGSGAKYTPAGIVHAGEVVWSQDDIKRWGGVGVVESMRTSSPGGYADGGVVDRDVRTVNAIQSQSGYGQSGGDVNVNITINQDGSSSTDVQGGQQKAATDILANGFRKIIMQECRQGGIIYNYVRS